MRKHHGVCGRRAGSARGEGGRLDLERLDVAQREAHLLRADGAAHAVAADAERERLAAAFLDAVDHAGVAHPGDGVALGRAFMLETLDRFILGERGGRRQREQAEGGENIIFHGASPCRWNKTCLRVPLFLCGATWLRGRGAAIAKNRSVIARR